MLSYQNALPDALRLAIIGSVAFALCQGSGISVNPPVAGLVFNLELLQPQSQLRFSVSGELGLDSYEWTFSGCGATPSSSSSAVVFIDVSSPGILNAHLKITRFGSGQVDEYDKQAYVIGGKIVLVSSRPADKGRERRVITNLVEAAKKQPLILEYFTEGSPETANTITGTGNGGQPPGTTYQWVLSGPITDTGAGTTSLACTVKATAGSSRGGAGVVLVYSKEVDGVTYSAQDYTDAYRYVQVHNTRYPDENYRSISCYTPSRIDPSPISSESYIFENRQSPPWSTGKHFTMQLWGNIGDPLDNILVQERYPDGVPTRYIDINDLDMDGNPPGTLLPSPFAWNGSTNYVWTSGQGPGGNQSGYSYHGKFRDTLRFGNWPGDPPNGQTGRPASGGLAVLKMRHRYWAATGVASGIGQGMPLDTYVGLMFTDDIIHTKE